MSGKETAVRGDRERTYEVLVFLVAVVWFLALSNRGINMVDEGWHLLRSYEIANGFMTYRDFFAPMAPGGFFIQAGLIKIFGLHLIVGRLYVVAQGMILILIALGLGKRHLKFPFSLAPATLYLAYSVGLSGFPHYNLDSALFLIICFAMLNKYIFRGGTWSLFTAGLFAGLAVGAKQNMVLVALPLIGTAILLCKNKHPRRGLLADLSLAGLGAAIPLLAIFLVLALTHSLEEARACLFGNLEMKKILFIMILPRALPFFVGGVVAVRGIIELSRRRPYLALPLWFLSILTGVALLLFGPARITGPLVCSVVTASLLLFVRPPENDSRPFWTLARVCGLLFFIATVISGVDLGHLLFACSGAAFHAGLSLQRAWDPKAVFSAKAPALCTFIVIMVLGFYLDLAVPHLEYAQGPRWEATSRVDLPGLELMRTSPQRAEELDKTVRWLKGNTDSGERIFVYPWDLIIHVLSERFSATYNTFLYFELFDQRILRRVISDLEANQPRVVVVRMEGDNIFHSALEQEAKAIEGYLVEHYQPEVRYGTYQIMTRKR